jgi:hypothetical protein
MDEGALASAGGLNFTPPPPLPLLPTQTPPAETFDVAANRLAIVADITTCATWLEAVNSHGMEIQRQVYTLLKAPEGNVTPSERDTFSRAVRRSVRQHSDVSRDALPRVVQGCRWCRLRAGTGISPEADEPCRRIEAALTANELLLTGRNRNNDQQTNAEGAKLAGAAGSNGGNLPALATMFEIMRAVNGTAYYVKETFAGAFDRDR